MERRVWGRMMWRSLLRLRAQLLLLCRASSPDPVFRRVTSAGKLQHAEALQHCEYSYSFPCCQMMLHLPMIEVGMTQLLMPLPW